ncbi:hypothetical protein NO1_0582 [Candidatus Termititenax aidoneus]|uniref:Uncharacterized protein n=1 Tax=Termititenax aidoneus TaxID=2218524 RepID=A0A388TA61_TERA1|nr:hypothetical protein NO1_0582 [Candidatus Termititenax aidoneus]
MLYGYKDGRHIYTLQDSQKSYAERLKYDRCVDEWKAETEKTPETGGLTEIPKIDDPVEVKKDKSKKRKK